VCVCVCVFVYRQRREICRVLWSDTDKESDLRLVCVCTGKDGKYAEYYEVILTRRVIFGLCVCVQTKTGNMQSTMRWYWQGECSSACVCVYRQRREICRVLWGDTDKESALRLVSSRRYSGTKSSGFRGLGTHTDTYTLVAYTTHHAASTCLCGSSVQSVSLHAECVYVCIRVACLFVCVACVEKVLLKGVSCLRESLA